MAESLVLRVENLQTHFQTRRGLVRAVNGVGFELHRGESLGLVGESGSGKSVTLQSILRMVPEPGGHIVDGVVELNGRDLLKLSRADMATVRGREVSMIMQDPMTSLDPLFSIGTQIGEAVQSDGQVARRRPIDRVLELLRAVNIPAPESRVGDYPHQLSGGMRQRIVAAISLASEPTLLLADEPTTALDVTIQMQFLGMLKEVQRDRQLALILVTHDLSIIAHHCDRVAVMYAGRLVETASTKTIFTAAHHPYTRGLLNSVPRIGAFPERLPTIEGQPPDLAALPSGCSYRVRCAQEMPICSESYPPIRDLGDGHTTACWLEPDGSAPANATGGNGWERPQPSTQDGSAG